MQDDRKPKRPDEGWTHEEKVQGAPQGKSQGTSRAAEGVESAEGADEAGTAGTGTPTARPSSDRATTEQAAAAIEKGAPGRAKPDPGVRR